MLALVLNAPRTAGAAVGRFPVVQRDLWGTNVIDVSANGLYALTGVAWPTRRVNLDSNTSVSIPFRTEHAHLTSDGLAMVFTTTESKVAGDPTGTWDVYRYVFATRRFQRLALRNAPEGWTFQLDDINWSGSVLGLTGTEVATRTAAAWIYDTVHGTWRRPDQRLVLPNVRSSGEVRLNASGAQAAFVAGTRSGTHGGTDVFLYNWRTNSATLISATVDGNFATHGSSDSPDISPDGRWVSFRSGSQRLAAGHLTAGAAVYVRDVVQRRTIFVTGHENAHFEICDGLVCPVGYTGPSLADDGASILVLEDVPGWDRSGVQPVWHSVATGASVVLDRPPGGAAANGAATNVVGASAAKRAVFTTIADNFAVVSPTGLKRERTFVSLLP